MKRLLVTLTLLLIPALAVAPANASVTPPGPDFTPIAVGGAEIYGSVVSGDLNLIRTVNVRTHATSDIAASQSSSLVASSWGAAMLANPDNAGHQQLLRVQMGKSPEVLATVPDSTPHCIRAVTPLAIDDAGTVTILDVDRTRVSGHCKVDTSGTSLYRLSASGQRTELWLPSTVRSRLVHGFLTVGGSTAILQDQRHMVVLDLAAKKIVRDSRTSKGSNAFFESRVDQSGAWTLLHSWTVPPRGSVTRTVRRAYFYKSAGARSKLLSKSRKYTNLELCGSRIAGFTEFQTEGAYARLRITTTGGRLVKRVVPSPNRLLISGPCDSDFLVFRNAKVRFSGRSGSQVFDEDLIYSKSLRVIDLKTLDEL